MVFLDTTNMEHMCLLYELECPECGSHNGYLQAVEEEGRHFCCPDCEAHWYDLKFCITDSKDNIA